MKISTVYSKFRKRRIYQLIENYCPISVLPVFSKYLEKVSNQQLTVYLENTNSISPNQRGFRKNKSMNSAVAQPCNSITEVWENRKQALNIFLDLQKEFDSLDRKTLGTQQTLKP